VYACLLSPLLIRKTQNKISSPLPFFLPSPPPSLPQVGVVTFWLVAAAIGSKSEDMVEICGWMFVFLNLIVLAFVFRNLGLGIKNINKEPVS